jgi:predicted AAA+ superfamily ATPase
MELRYVRDTDRREVDFVVLRGRKPVFAVECKLKDRPASPHLWYFKERTKIPLFYQVSLSGDERQLEDGITLIGFESFCKRLNLV